ncbi:MAG: ABC transporter substrate-binding protein [Deltaproteobacteria bacterium]|jgi:putative spermidine/putrescine transport system substrate-binding protein|nr:ABC transporter substrate-binding protein [Deltaproteobacteria bacterium]
MLRKALPFALICLFYALPAMAQDAVAVCYNCPPEWAGWGYQLELIKKETGITVPMDNKNSGQSVSQLIAEKGNPVADVSYLGISFAINAMREDVITPYKGPGWESVPANLKDPDGNWVSIHSGSLGLMVNVDALEGKPVPKSWKDLLDPQYKGMVGFLDPGSAFVGYVGAVAINEALGGSLDNFDPAINYFKELKENDPIVSMQTSYARVLSGEIPILLDYDFDAYRARYTDKANVEFVIPAEGSILVPYVMTLVKNGPHQENGKKVIDFVLSDKGQKLWAENYLRPVHARFVTPDIAARFLPDGDYARVKPIDYAKMAEVQAAFAARYQAEVK